MSNPKEQRSRSVDDSAKMEADQVKTPAEEKKTGKSKTTRGQAPPKGQTRSKSQSNKIDEATSISDTQLEHCGTCGNQCKESENSLQCELCDIWYHTDCENIDDATYQLLKKDADRPYALLHYYCSRSCNKAASKFLGGMLKLECDVEQLKSKMGEMENKVTNIQNGNFTDEMINKIKDINNEHKKENPQLSNTEEVIKILEAKNRDHREEIDDKLRRRCNLIIFKAPENTSLSTEEAKLKDDNLVMEIMKEIKATHKPSDTRRLGNISQDKESATNQRSRPLRLTFPSETERVNVLQAYHKTRKQLSEEDVSKQVAKVSIRKDLTPQERKEEEQLYLELKSKKVQSEKSGDEYAHWIRSRGRVINIGKYPVDAASRP
uniref:PHD zinc finger domain protein n=1 Tax=Elysia chlorotica TaxID=188477 RepID=A0A1S5V2M5_ELYCH|nr:PHD zinc finger domain protein [Elysia chlorotica]